MHVGLAALGGPLDTLLPEIELVFGPPNRHSLLFSCVQRPNILQQQVWGGTIAGEEEIKTKPRNTTALGK